MSTLLSARPITFDASAMIAANSPSSRLRRTRSSARYSGISSAGAGGTYAVGAGAGAGVFSARAGGGCARRAVLRKTEAPQLFVRRLYLAQGAAEVRAARSQSVSPVRRR